MPVRLPLSLLAVCALMIINGVFVAAEFAIVRVRRTRLKELAGEGKAAAKHAIVVVDGVTEYLAVTQIGITAASLGVGWFGEDSFARLFILLLPGARIPTAMVHVVAAMLAFLLITTMHVVLGELVPKHLAIRRAEHLLLVLARPLQMLHVVLRPLHWFFETLSTFTLRCLGHGEVPVTPLTEEELKLVLMDSHEEGVLTEGEARPLLLREKSNAVFERAARPPIKIPVDLPQDGILRLLQEGRGHLGIVRDRDDQKTLGIVTLEDVLESLVGDVREAPRGESPPC